MRLLTNTPYSIAPIMDGGISVKTDIEGVVCVITLDALQDANSLTGKNYLELDRIIMFDSARSVFDGIVSPITQNQIDGNVVAITSEIVRDYLSN